MKKSRNKKNSPEIGMNRPTLEFLGEAWLRFANTEAVIYATISRLAGSESPQLDEAVRQQVRLESLNAFQRGAALCLENGIPIPPDLLQSANLNLKRPPPGAEIH